MTRNPLHTLLAFLIHATLVCSVQTFFPASIPLSTRSPYLDVWQSTVDGSYPLSYTWPLTWDQQAHMGWSGKIRIDEIAYEWLGQDEPNSITIVTNIQITPTRSIFTMRAGPMTFNVTFLSPVEPADWVKQSIPFSYLSVDISADDGLAHDVQIYSDITAEWVSGNRSSLIQYNFTNTSQSLYHTIALQDPIPYREIAEQADDGTSYYAMSQNSGATVTWQVDDSGVSRRQFESEGSLKNATNTAFNAVQDGSSWPVFAFCVDLGHIQSTASPVMWAVGYVRDPTVRYTTPAGEIQDRRPYFTTQFSDVASMIDSVTSDFSAAYDRAVALDLKIMGDAAKISGEYVDLVSLTTRQTLSTLDITTYTDSNGNIDPSDILIFMKDVGTSQRVNPVERIFAALPAFLYLNASLVGPILKPLLIMQDGLTGQPYASPDLGSQYPVVSGDNAVENQGIEQSGNMLIMMYAHARFSGDGTLLAAYYNLTKRWADYLVNNTLTFNDQVFADGETTGNMTNLALKGIIGVKAMAEIARAVGEGSDALHYDNQSSTLFGLWQSLAQSSSQSQHILGEYGNESSWSMLYNVYADVLLGTDLVPQSLLKDQTSFYDNILLTAPALGLPIDSSTSETASTAWTLFTSAILTNNTVRDQFIARTWARASNNMTVGAFPDTYDVSTGNSVGGNAGPAGGAMFAHLALTLTNSTISIANSTVSIAPPNQTIEQPEDSNKSRSKIPVIVGGVIGVLAAAAIILATAVILGRKRFTRLEHDRHRTDLSEELKTPPSSQPYFGHIFSLVNNNTSLAAQADGNFREAPQAVGRDGGMSSKARNRMSMTYSRLSRSLLLAVGSRSGPGRTREPLASQAMSQVTDGPSAGSLSTTDVAGLRLEVEHLRQMMEVMRAERREDVGLPPAYETEYRGPNP